MVVELVYCQCLLSAVASAEVEELAVVVKEPAVAAAAAVGLVVAYVVAWFVAVVLIALVYWHSIS